MVRLGRSDDRGALGVSVEQGLLSVHYFREVNFDVEKVNEALATQPEERSVETGSQRNNLSYFE